MLERQVGRPEMSQGDRTLLDALSRVLPRPARRRSAFVKLATLLRWHRERELVYGGRLARKSSFSRGVVRILQNVI